MKNLVPPSPKDKLKKQIEKVQTYKTPQQIKRIKEHRICKMCQMSKHYTQFYAVNDIDFSHEEDASHASICKLCVKKMAHADDGSFYLDGFKKALSLIGRPYIPEALDTAINEVQNSIDTITETNGRQKRDIIGIYFRIVNGAYKNQTFIDSINKLKSDDGSGLNKEFNKEGEMIYSQHDDDFDVNEKILDLFGDGYSKQQYLKMYRKFEKLKLTYGARTTLHEEALATYVRFKVQEENATAEGKVDEAIKWNKAAQEWATSAKLTPKQLNEADLHGGITEFSSISEAVENAVDIIPILPEFKKKPKDEADFIIWCYINYARKLQNLPTVEYKDIYKFYDEMKDKYLKDNGGDIYNIFENDTENREAVEQFIIVDGDDDD